MQFARHVLHGLGQLVEPTHIAQVHGAGKLVQRHSGQVVAFVKNHQAVVQIGQGLQAQGGQHQIVVGDDDIGLSQPGAGVVVAALLELGAVARGAGVALGRHARPVAAVWRLRQRIAVAIPGAAGQHIGHVVVELDAALFYRLLRGGGQGRHREVLFKHIFFAAARASQAVQLDLADIAPTALGQRKDKGLVHGGGQCGQILAHQLLLQGHGGGGNQHARLALQCHADGGAEVGRALAHTGTGLDHGNGLVGRGALAQVGAR